MCKPGEPCVPDVNISENLLNKLASTPMMTRPQMRDAIREKLEGTPGAISTKDFDAVMALMSPIYMPSDPETVEQLAHRLSLVEAILVITIIEAASDDEGVPHPAVMAGITAFTQKTFPILLGALMQEQIKRVHELLEATGYGPKDKDDEDDDEITREVNEGGHIPPVEDTAETARS